MGWKRGHGLCSPQPPSWLVGTPPSSLPRSHGLGDLRGSHREETGAPALDRQRSLAPALLPTAEKQEKVIIFEFLRFAFNFFTPPLRSSLKTSSVYGGYWILIYHRHSPWRRLQSSEQTQRQMFALVIFHHFILGNDHRRERSLFISNSCTKGRCSKTKWILRTH